MTSVDVAHEDDRLIAVVKPAGQATAPGGGIAPGASLQEQVAEHIGARAFLVHRLDRDTSGVIVFARDSAEHRRLSLLFEGRQVDKSYLAVVQGHMGSPSGEIRDPLREFGSGRVGVDPRGKDALTRWTARERLADAHLLDVTAQTGRRHQIRVHLYAAGHPILGDTRYGEERPIGAASRLMLHALQLTLPDADGRPMTLRADPPADFEAILESHRR
jgi:RluA family pseudouridine synthase